MPVRPKTATRRRRRKITIMTIEKLFTLQANLKIRNHVKSKNEKPLLQAKQEKH